ncbi:hypothetical protein [Bacillus solimangrovi]|uniref:Uncharacterized protein n=1 Tax=Bacillus solimangrovi TaxID=1305675 RepID=A0A1E5LAE4_9BACI|nr:hypothetical protein [Bacillus solimangrovi]OEH91068.1 hypothetical protein BFG57_06760 [Bacillus solimangrovi]
MRRYLMTVVLILLVGCTVKNQLTLEEEVRQHVENYLFAVETDDVTSIIEYADDLRSPDKEEQEKEYLEISLSEEVFET